MDNCALKLSTICLKQCPDSHVVIAWSTGPCGQLTLTSSYEELMHVAVMMTKCLASRGRPGGQLKPVLVQMV